MSDELLEQIAQYVMEPPQFSEEAYSTAALCLADALGCAFLALNFPACTKLLGPVIPETVVPNGCRVPGTPYILDPILAAFNIGTMIRWLDYNDTWLAEEWGHPSDNLGGLIACCDYIQKPLKVRDLLTAMIKAYEIQGVIALDNCFNKVGLDHVILVKIATAAVTAQLLGADSKQLISAISNAWVDIGAMRTYRHAPNTGSRKSWAAGDATSRGLFFAWLAMKNEMGYPEALTAKNWGLYDVLFQGRPFTLQRPFGCYVMENILFKIAYPAEFHAQTAVEAAIKLSHRVAKKLDQIESIHIETQQPAIRIIDKKGPLNNPADRDHCLQYMVAVGLLKGRLIAEDYNDEAAKDPRIDQLRNKVIVTENPLFSKDYLDPEKRSIAARLTIQLHDEKIEGPLLIDYPLGHRRRRSEGIPLLREKFQKNLLMRFPKQQTKKIIQIFEDEEKLFDLSFSEFLDFYKSHNRSGSFF